MQAVRTALFTTLYFLSGVFWGTLSILTWVLPAMWRHRVIILWTRFIITMLGIVCGTKYKITGKENLQNLGKPVVVLAKHQSTWETLFLQGLFFPASTVLKKELLHIPFFGWGLSGLRPIAIDRTDPIKALKKVKHDGIKRLEEGLNLILFPEGTRVQVGEKNKYARSGVDIALKAGASIIPVAHNAGVFWPNDSKVKLAGEIQIVIGEPINPEGRPSKEVIAEVEAWIEGQIEKLPRS